MCRIIVKGSELVGLKRHAHEIPECPGLDRRIQRYDGNKPLAMSLDELDWLVAVLDAVLHDPKGYPCVEHQPWKLEYVPSADERCAACRRLYERLEQESDRLFEVVMKKRSKEPKPRRVPAKVQPTYDAITALTDTFCQEHLNEEYAELSRRLAGVLGRKRPTPITRGRVESWACGIVRAIGWVNFLNDPSQTPHMKTEAVNEAFGVSSATGAAKLKEIRETLKLMPMHPDWTLPSKLGDNPLAWMVEIDGIAMDARALPKEIQQEVFRLGLIPYIPDEEGRDES